MTQTEFLRRMVLNEICDDFENVEQIILPNVAEQARKLGLVVQRNDIVEALRPLVGELNGLPVARGCRGRFPGLLLRDGKG
jgi:hypothetical protein